MKPGKRTFLHVQVGFDVMVRRDGALKSEPQCDYADVDASLCRCMAVVWRLCRWVDRAEIFLITDRGLAPTGLFTRQ
jgi:hypothetical protein